MVADPSVLDVGSGSHRAVIPFLFFCRRYRKPPLLRTLIPAIALKTLQSTIVIKLIATHVITRREAGWDITLCIH